MSRRFAGLIAGTLLLLGTAFFFEEPMAMAADTAKTEAGTVVEAMKVPGYTYMLVDTGAAKNWVAIPETEVTVGQKVRYTKDMTMKNFTSKTLNKTFENVIFSTGLVKDSGAAPAAKPATEDSFAAAVKAEQQATAAPAMPAVSGGSSGAVVPLSENISVPKADAANGHTVAELFDKAKELNGKKVTLRGKVVKFNPNIMGKNWVHLQDGTGDPMHNTHDMVVTTGDTVELNSVVTFEGTLAADKDFGAGYKYAAIIEDATLKK